MTIGRSAANSIKIKTDGEAGLRAVECACCGPCGGCPPLSDVLPASTYNTRITGLGCPPNIFGSEQGLIDEEEELTIAENCVALNNFVFIRLIKDGGECYVGITPSAPPAVALSSSSEEYRKKIVGGSVDISGTYNFEYILECYYVSPQNCNGTWIPGENGVPDRCEVKFSATLTIS
jgi:hypothetical protein